MGDALGAPLEGLSRREIVSEHGRVDNYVRSFSRRNLEPGQWTDDTALALATLQSLIVSRTLDLPDIKERMVSAYNMEPFRGYGPNTRKVLEGKRPSVRSVGNGAAMRIAPVALFFHDDLAALREGVEKVGRITHISTDSIDGAQAVAFAIARAVRGELVPGSLIGETIEYLGPNADMSYKLGEVRELLEDQRIGTDDALEHIGTRGLALESVGSAFYSFLKSPPDFYESVIRAVNAGGDTDTIGCLTGYLSGAYNGDSRIDRKWLGRLEARSELEYLSDDLADLISQRSQ